MTSSIWDSRNSDENDELVNKTTKGLEISSCDRFTPYLVENKHWWSNNLKEPIRLFAAPNFPTLQNFARAFQLLITTATMMWTCAMQLTRSFVNLKAVA